VNAWPRTEPRFPARQCLVDLVSPTALTMAAGNNLPTDFRQQRATGLVTTKCSPRRLESQQGSWYAWPSTHDVDLGWRRRHAAGLWRAGALDAGRLRARYEIAARGAVSRR
jgi:hypothetical protein